MTQRTPAKTSGDDYSAGGGAPSDRPPHRTMAATANPAPLAGQDGAEAGPGERTPWLSFMARHLFDDVDPATLARDGEGPPVAPG